jgi:hypothetical protein
MVADAGCITGCAAAAEALVDILGYVWVLAAGLVSCSYRRRESLEPAAQSRTETPQKSALKIYLMPRNLGLQHTLPRGARALF